MKESQLLGIMEIENKRVIETVKIFLVDTWRVRKLDTQINGNGRVASWDHTYEVCRELCLRGDGINEACLGN